MHTNFRKTTYLAVVKENQSLDNDHKIYGHAKNDLKYNYSDVNYQAFKHKYTAENWFGRKFVAFPKSIYVGIVKSIYHLTQVIFYSLKNTTKSLDNPQFQVKLYTFERDLQEAYGWAMTFFNDSYGQYHVQKSEFNKTCYTCFLNDKINPKTSSPSSKPSDQTIDSEKEPKQNLTKETEGKKNDETSSKKNEEENKETSVPTEEGDKKTNEIPNTEVKPQPSTAPQSSTNISNNKEGSISTDSSSPQADIPPVSSSTKSPQSKDDQNDAKNSTSKPSTSNGFFTHFQNIYTANPTQTSTPRPTPGQDSSFNSNQGSSTQTPPSSTQQFKSNFINTHKTKEL